MIGRGKVVQAFGNLIYVEFEGSIKQGEVAFVHAEGLLLQAEVIEITGNRAKLQVFEDTKGIKLDDEVEFSSHLLEAELGPGLLSSIFDGLQNPLEKVAEQSGYFLNPGVYIPPLDRVRKWEFIPKAKIGDVLLRGDCLGEVTEGIFTHKIMLPFSINKKITITFVAVASSYTIEEVIVKGKDEEGQEYSFSMLQRWPVKASLIEGKKIKPTSVMTTGLRIIDTQFPVLQGGTFCSPGPFGAGKTVLQHHLSKYSEVDIVIVAACGERAGEVVEILKEFPHLQDVRTGEPLIKRTVIVCNTSSMPVAAREASVYMGVTIAEYYRQMGYNVLLLADSTSRWAQAMREMSGRLEEIPGEEAFPAYLASRIASFYERAGVVELREGKKGSVTICGAVSPAGGNFEEPVTQATLSVVGAFLGLSRERSDARRFPAIDPLISWTKYLVQTGVSLDNKFKGWVDKVEIASSILKTGNEISKRMEVVGEEGTALDDFIVYLKSELYDYCYLQQNSFDKVDAYCSQERQIELFSLLQKVFELSLSFESHDDARTYFLKLQNEIKNMNFIPYKSEQYNESIKKIVRFIMSGKESYD